MTMKNKNLIWVYPRNNWVSNFKKTFVYGWCNPKAKLFVSSGGVYCNTPVQKIKIFPNGNFAKTIKLPHEKNVIRLIQILNRKKKVITRHVIARKPVRLTKQSYKSDIGQVRLLCSPRLCLGGAGRYSVPPRNDTVIVIDPGHGGKEHGTHSPKDIPEKHFNLQIAKLLFGKLKNKYKYVYLTRSKDKYVSLKDRVNFAKKKKCNLFISIHHNALPDNEDPLKHRGVGIYYTHDFVKPFAKKLLESISKEVAYCNTPLRKYGIFKRDFAVTRPDFYCGVLIECGFLIHPKEGEYVTQKKVQERIVLGIMKSLQFS